MDITDIAALANLVPGGKYAALLPFLVFGAKLITTLTPTRADNDFLDKALGFLNLLALNIGRDRNKDA